MGGGRLSRSRFAMKLLATLLAVLVAGAGCAAQSAPADDAAACNNAGFLATQHAHANRAEVTFCGTVVRLRPALHTRSGWHRYIFIDVGHNNPIEIDANLDEMGSFPVTLGEHAAVKGEYYYDPNGREGVHWTHHTDRGSHPPGYLNLNGTIYR